VSRIGWGKSESTRMKLCVRPPPFGYELRPAGSQAIAQNDLLTKVGQCKSSNQYNIRAVRLNRGTSVATVPRRTAPPNAQRPRARSYHCADMRRTTARNDGDRAYFCMVCDKNFASNDALQEHLLIHDPGYIRPPAVAATSPEVIPNGLLQGYCWVCDQAFGTKLEKHLRLSALHRSWTNYSSAHSDPNRPELWCHMCEVLFTHTDRKRKHLDEMYDHNTRLEQMDDAAVQRATSSSHTGITVTHAESIHYCRPCDRYFSTAEELRQHQSLEDCGDENRRRRNANARPSTAPPRPNFTSATLTSTTSQPSSHSPTRPATEPEDVEDPSLPPPSYESILAADLSTLTPPHEREQRPDTSRRPRPTYPDPDHLLPALPTASSSRALPPPPPSPPPKDLRIGLRSSRSAPSLHPAFECALCMEHEVNVSALACGHMFGTR
ncbi:hypothetical protein M0805_006789, partial [Coniferiporia weirii]